LLETTHQATATRSAAYGNGMGAVCVLVLAACHVLDRAFCPQCARLFAD